MTFHVSVMSESIPHGTSKALCWDKYLLFLKQTYNVTTYKTQKSSTRLKVICFLPQSDVWIIKTVYWCLLQGLDTEISNLCRWTVSGKINEQIIPCVAVWISLFKSLKKRSMRKSSLFPAHWNFLELAISRFFCCNSFQCYPLAALQKRRVSLHNLTLELTSVLRPQLTSTFSELLQKGSWELITP